MKYLKSYKLFESRFLEFREIISTIKDICQEFEDNNCHCEVEPKDDILLNIVSLKSRGHVSSIKQKFYLDIDIDGRIMDKNKGGIFGILPDWFIETCKRIEDYMLDNGFKTLPSIKYPTEWENFESIDELDYAIGLFGKVRLDFIPTAKPLDESISYNADWKKHNSSIRSELEKDLNDILLEVKDLGFHLHISGWTEGNDHPYVWIRATSKTPTPMIEHTKDVVERIEDYLSQKGYQTKVDILNENKSSMQIYIYFDIELEDDLKTKQIDIEHLRESTFEDLDYNLIQEADVPVEPGKWSWTKDLTIPTDMQLEIHDMSYELRDEGYTIGYQWWPPYEQHNKLYKDNKYPSINITKHVRDNEQGGLEKIYYGHIKDFCDRVISYLDDMDYNGVVKFRKLNTNEYYEISNSNVNWGPFKDYPMCMSIHYKIEMISRKVYGDVHV